MAPVWFLACWIGYTLYADRGQAPPNLMQRMHAYRRLWMRAMLARDSRMVDTQILRTPPRPELKSIVRSKVYSAWLGGLVASEL